MRGKSGWQPVPFAVTVVPEPDKQVENGSDSYSVRTCE